MVSEGKEGKKISGKGRKELCQGLVSDKAQCIMERLSAFHGANPVGFNCKAGMFLEQFCREGQVEEADYWSVFGELKQSTF